MALALLLLTNGGPRFFSPPHQGEGCVRRMSPGFSPPLHWKGLLLRRVSPRFSPPLQGEGWVGMVSAAPQQFLPHHAFPSVVIPAKAGIHFDLCLKVQSFVSSCGRAGSFLASPKKEPKSLGTGRGVCGAPAPQIPCASRHAGVAQTVRPCTAEQSRRSIAATLRASSRRACDARHRERRRFLHVRRPSMDCAGVACTENVVWFCSWFWLLLLLRLLRQDAAHMGPHEARRMCAGKVRRMTRRMRASSLHAQGCAFSEPRSPFADPQGRMPEGRAIRGVFLW